jgi:hypothetical protein
VQVVLAETILSDIVLNCEGNGDSPEPFASGFAKQSNSSIGTCGAK